MGLDGVPFTLLGELIEQGRLPSLRRILADGGLRLRQMDASIPDVSSTSWTSFMTGVNPGEHGIYGFMSLKPGGYELSFPNFNDVKAPTIWEILGDSRDSRASSLKERFSGRIGGRFRSIVLNVPQTYPAAPLNGVLTAGFVCLDLKKGTYPDSACDYLESIGFVSDVDANKAVSDKEGFFSDLERALEKRAEAYRHFMVNDQWDLFIGVITETDRLHHFFYDAARDPEHPDNAFFVDFYRKIDSLIGQLYDLFLEKTDGEGMFMTMSDHGFTTIRQEVYLNAWLEKEGFLRLNRERKYFEQIDTGTRAFAMDPGRIYIHLEGKYPRGGVKEFEKERIMQELKEKLAGLKSPGGEPVIAEIHENGDIYKGAFSGDGPDLVCVGADGFDLKGVMGKSEPFGKSHFRGMHTAHDAHCVLPAGLADDGRLGIEDLAGYILNRYTG